MPKISLKIGNRDLILNYEEGDEGFVEVQEKDTDLSLLVRVEPDDNHLWATFFPADKGDPDWFFDLDEYDADLQ